MPGKRTVGMVSMKGLRGLYAIADTSLLPAGRLATAVQCAIEGGASAVQYRDKAGSAERRDQQARALVSLGRSYGVPIIINDDAELAARVGAAGVHLGREDAALAHARRLLPAPALIGVSCYNELERALSAQAQHADYVAFGSFFPSPTKPRAVRATLELLHTAKRQLHIPVVAIGGITPENGAALVEAGADALAVINGLFAAPDIKAAAERYTALFAALEA